MDLASRLETVEAVLKAEITARLAAEARAKEELSRSLEATSRLNTGSTLVAALEARLAVLEASTQTSSEQARLASRLDALSEATSAAAARADAAAVGLAALQPLASASGARGARGGVLERLDAIEAAIEGVWRDLATQEAVNEEVRAVLEAGRALGLPPLGEVQAADAVLEAAVAAAEEGEEGTAAGVERGQ
jgi:hypothetical protein